MKFLLLLLILLVVSCGNYTEAPVRQPIITCEEASFACLPRADWQLKVTKKDFPENISLTVWGQEILNECGDIDSRATISRKPNVLIELKQSQRPLSRAKQVDVTILDLGKRCNKSKVYFENKQQTYRLYKKDSVNFLEILIN